LPINPTKAIATEVGDSPIEQVRKPSIAQDSIEITSFVAATTSEPLSLPVDHVPIETSAPITPVPEVPATNTSPVKIALQVTNKAMTTINLSNAWERALERIKWVMETVNPVAEVCGVSFLSILSFT